MEDSLWYAPKDMGGAPPHKNNLIGRSTEISLLKLTTTAENALCSLLSSLCSLLLLAHSRTIRKLGTLDSRLTIRLKTPSKSIQHVVEVITTRNKQLNIFSAPTEKLRPPIARGLPGDVTLQRFKPSEISG